RPDLAVSRLGGQAILQNTSTNGAITFGPRIKLEIAAGSSSTAFGDLDGDGKPELLFTHANDTVSVLRNATPTIVCTPPPFGLVGWWRAEGDALDAIGTNHGTLQGGAIFAAGKVGQAFSLNGTGSFVQFPNAARLNVAGAITIEAWIMPTVIAGTD